MSEALRSSSRREEAERTGPLSPSKKSEEEMAAAPWNLFSLACLSCSLRGGQLAVVTGMRICRPWAEIASAVEVASAVSLPL